MLEQRGSKAARAESRALIKNVIFHYGNGALWVLWRIITSRCLGSRGLADIKFCRVLERQWHGEEELGPPPAGLAWWHQDWVGHIHFTLSESCSHSTSAHKRLSVLHARMFFLIQVRSDSGEFFFVLGVRCPLFGAFRFIWAQWSIACLKKKKESKTAFNSLWSCH